MKSTAAELQLGAGLSFPPRVGTDGRLVWSGGEENIRESIRIILLTNRLERIRRPDFGGDLKPFLFESNTLATHTRLKDRIEKALTRWEPRIRVESVRVDAAPDDREAAVVTVTYRLVATQMAERLTLSVNLAA